MSCLGDLVYFFISLLGICAHTDFLCLWTNTLSHSLSANILTSAMWESSKFFGLWVDLFKVHAQVLYISYLE